MSKFPQNTSDSLAMVFKDYSPHTPWPILNENFRKLSEKYSFDLERMRDEVSKILTNYDLKAFKIKKNSNKIRRTYKGIGITYRPGAEDQIYDALLQNSEFGQLDISETFMKQRVSLPVEDRFIEKTFERNYSLKNELYSGYMAEVLDQFKSPMTKTRLSELSPKGILSSHVDFPYYEQIRVHAVLWTNANCWWSVNGELFQIPADGNFYWFDTGKYHAVWNDGDVARLIISVNLSVYRNRDGSLRFSPDRNLFSIMDSAEL